LEERVAQVFFDFGQQAFGFFEPEIAHVYSLTT
jgi:hypothetical protein